MSETKDRRTLDNFGALLEGENKLVQGNGTGDPVVIGDGTLPKPGDADRVVRAEMIRFLLLGGNADNQPHPTGVRLSGAWVTGKLELQGCRGLGNITMNYCHFDHVLNLEFSEVQSLSLYGSMFPGISGRGLTVHSDISLVEAKPSELVGLNEARIGSDLKCLALKNEKSTGTAFSAVRATVGGTASFDEVTIHGELIVDMAKIHGDLYLANAKLYQKRGMAFSADMVTVGGDINFNYATVQGQALFSGAKLGGTLTCVRATFEGEGDALKANRINARDVILKEIIARGKVSMLGAQIGGDLSCMKCNFCNDRGVSFDLGSATVDGTISFEQKSGFLGQLHSYRFDLEC